MQEVKTGEVQSVCRAAAAWMVSRIAAALNERGQALLALPGGNSIKPLIRELASALEKEQDLLASGITVFLADERVLPSGHEERNDALVAALFRASGVTAQVETYVAPENRSKAGVFIAKPPLEEEAASPDRAAERYSEEFASAGGTIDLAVLGVGEDGHIASLFPNHPLLGSNEHGYAAITDSPKPPPQRITLLPKSIAEARAAVALFFGERKRDALRGFLSGDAEPTSLPASLVKSVADRLILTDQIDLVDSR
ncbi:MAG: 6-phosphogluconolactonase [Spirochaetales bacterium]